MFRVRSLAENPSPAETTAGGFASELTTRSGLARTPPPGAENAAAETPRETTSATASTWKRMATGFPQPAEPKREPRFLRSRLVLGRPVRSALPRPGARRQAVPRPPPRRRRPRSRPLPRPGPPRPRLLPQLLPELRPDRAPPALPRAAARRLRARPRGEASRSHPRRARPELRSVRSA